MSAPNDDSALRCATCAAWTDTELVRLRRANTTLREELVCALTELNELRTAAARAAADALLNP